MKPTFEELSAELISRNVRPSFQRVKVLEYLVENQCHPPADQIFHALQRDIPTLSKSTVYNTLHLFIKSGLVRELTMESQEARYDIITKPHGHFTCGSCGRIYDFRIDRKGFSTQDLKGFEITTRDVYFKGTCARCLSNKNKPKEELS